MIDANTLLTTLQHGDSFFPSGAVSFSWGLETLCMEGQVSDSNGVREFLTSQLKNRWATFDRGVVVAAHRNHSDIEVLASLDGQVNAMTLAREMREGSRRAGSALLSVHAKLGTPGADAYRTMVRDHGAYGHLSMTQGFLWAARAVPTAHAETLSAHLLCVGMLGAALRLGIIGHVDTQSILASVRPLIARILSSRAPGPDRWHAFTPETEIAVMRHETADTRLFAN